MAITLTDEKLKELEVFIGELPTKFGVPMLNFFQELSKEQSLVEEAKEAVLPINEGI